MSRSLAAAVIEEGGDGAAVRIGSRRWRWCHREEQDGGCGRAARCGPVEFGSVDVTGINLARRFGSGGKGVVVGVTAVSTLCKKHIESVNEHSIEPVGVGRESKTGMGYVM